MKNITLWILLLFWSVTKAQVTVWQDDFTSGAGSWTLNQAGTVYIPGSTPTNGSDPNEWIVNNDYGAQPTSPNGGNYLHITCTSFICSFLGAPGPVFNASDASNNTNRAAVLTTAIPGATLSTPGNYTLRFEWLCEAGSGPHGFKMIYSVNGGAWQEYSTTYKLQSSWQNEAIDLSTLGWNPGDSFRMGFRWFNSGSSGAADPPAMIDNVRITRDVATNTITTTALGTTTFCAGNNLTVDFTSTGTYNAGNVYSVELSDATGSFASPTVIGTLNSTANSGTISCMIPGATPAGANYRIRVVASNPATIGTDSGQNIVINSTISPTVSISANPGTTICTGESVTFTATPTGLGGVPPTYQWTLNGANVGTNSVTYTNNSLNNGDQVQVTMSFNGPCNSGSVSSNIETMTVSSGVAPEVSISVSPNDTVCAGTNLIFTATPTNGGANPAYQWTVNGVNVGTNSATFTSNSLNNGDVVQCTMTSSSSCISGSPTVVSNEITIVFGLTVNCSTSGGIVGSPATVNISVSGGAAPYSFQVTNFGDNTNDTQNGVNSQSASFTHTYSTPGSFNVQVTVTDANGCSATSNCTMVITNNVTNLPTASFTSSPLSGCTPLTVQFTNTSTNAVSYSWDFGDGNTSTDANPTHTYAQVGTYNVTLIATNADGNDTVFSPNQVIVYPEVIAGAIVTNICLTEPTFFTDNSVHAVSWSWDFGDGNTSTDQNPQHFYAATGTYNVTLTVTGLGGCTATTNISVEVLENPTSAFTFTTERLCNSFIATFENQSTNSTSHFWDFGDGNFSTDPNPVHTYATTGTFTVRYTAINGVCESQTTNFVTVTFLPSPSADITGPTQVIKVGETVIFENLSVNADSMIWDFGNGQTLIQTQPFTNPSMSYEDEGTYTVVATALSNGCTSSDTVTVTVEYPEVIWIPNAFTPNGDGTNDTWFPKIEGYQDYEVIIHDRWGVFITSLKPNDVWDGTFNGKPCSEGVYFFHIKGKFKKGKKIDRIGSTTLIR